MTKDESVVQEGAENPPVKQSKIANAAMIMVIAVILSRLLGMLRDIIIAHQFGRSAHTDVYYAAFSLPDALMYLIAGGAISSTFIPVFTDYLQKDKEEEAWKVFSVVLNVVMIGAIFFIVLAEIFARPLVHLLNLGYSAQTLDECIPLTRIVLPAQFFFLAGSLFMGTLNARHKMLAPALGPSIYNLGIIIGALLAHPDSTGPFGGMKALMWGGLVGAFVGNLLLQAIAAKFEGLKYTLSFDIRHSGVVKMGKMMLPILLGISLPNVDQIIMKESASFFDKGSQTALNYANRTMLIPIGIFAQAMSIAVLPSMSQQTANGNLKEFKRITGKTLRTILFLTVPCSALMFVISLPIIQTLYQHGKFHASDAIATACALRFYCIGIFAWSCQAILTRGFYAMQDTITTVKTGTVMTLVFCLLNFIAIKFVGQTHPILGIEAIAFNTSLAATLYMIWLFVILRKRMRGLQDKALHMTSVRIIVASIALVAASAIPLSLWNMLLAGHRTGTLNSLAQVIVCSVLGGWAYYKVTQYYQLAELDSVLSMAKSRIAPLKRIVDKLIAKFGIRSNS